MFLRAFAACLILTAPAAFAAEDGNQESGAPPSGQGERRGPPPGGHRGPPNLTDAQRTCLEGILGKPGEGERPSHEKMHAAMESCGVPKPPHHGGRRPKSDEGDAMNAQDSDRDGDRAE